MTTHPEKTTTGKRKSERKRAVAAKKDAGKRTREEARSLRAAVCNEDDMDTESLARWLESAAQGLRAGSLSVTGEEQEAVLITTGIASVRIKARRGRRRMRLSLRAVWSPEKAEPREEI